MNRTAFRPNLPWLAAGTAMLTVLAWHGFIFGTEVLHEPSDNGLIFSLMTMTLKAVGEGLLIDGGLAFLVVQSRGERRQEWTFKRPAVLMAVFAAGLLAWDLARMFLSPLLLQLLGEEAALRWWTTLMAGLDLLLAPLAVWSSWRLTVLVCSADSLPAPTPSGQRPRAAGLAAWLQAVAIILGVSLLLPLYSRFDPYTPTAWLSTWGGALLAAAAAFAGAWRGLPRQLSQVRIGRLLGAGLPTLVCAWLLLFGAGLAALILALGAGGYVDSTLAFALFLVLAILPLAGMFGFQWLWTRVCYAKLRRAATA